jgi:Uma2 family endonuclease
MSTPTTQTKLTYDDYVLIPDDGKRHEIIDGEEYVSPSPREKHQRLVGQLHYLIARYLGRKPVGRVYVAPFDVILSAHDIVQPDVLFVAKQTDIITELNVKGAPDLAVEILSEGYRQRDEAEAGALRKIRNQRVLGR